MIPAQSHVAKALHAAQQHQLLDGVLQMGLYREVCPELALRVERQPTRAIPTLAAPRQIDDALAQNLLLP